MADGQQVLPQENCDNELMTKKSSREAYENSTASSSNRDASTSSLIVSSNNQTGFDSSAKLSVFKFRPGVTSFGTLHVSVVYESEIHRVIALANGRDANLVHAVIPVSLTNEPINISESSFQNHLQETNKSNTDDENNVENEISRERNMQELHERRAASGSPLPSPSMQRRALGYSHLKLSRQQSLSSSSPLNGTDGSKPWIDPNLIEKTVSKHRASLTRPPSQRSSLSFAMSRQSTASSNEDLSLQSEVDSDTDDRNGGMWNLNRQNRASETLVKPVPTRPAYAPSHHHTANNNAVTVMPPLIDSEEDTYQTNNLAAQLSKSFDAVLSLGHTRSSNTGSSFLTGSAAAYTPEIMDTNYNLNVPISSNQSKSRRISLPSRVNTAGFRSYYDGVGISSQSGIRSSVPTPSSELFGSFVGSYEQSILNGRMSTLPSKPINFLAEIGVIGLGKCKPSLKCPSHLILEFPAHFYELFDEISPATPYVGSIEVDWAMAVRESGASENIHGVASGQRESHDTQGPIMVTSPHPQLYLSNSEPETTQIIPDNTNHVDDSRPRRSKSKEFAKKQKQEYVGYRIPQKGQLQIVIKNPSRLAIKVFLVPYDFRDMPPNTKTFLRQKSYVQTTVTPPSMSVFRKHSSSVSMNTTHTVVGLDATNMKHRASSASPSLVNSTKASPFESSRRSSISDSDVNESDRREKERLNSNVDSGTHGTLFERPISLPSNPNLPSSSTPVKGPSSAPAISITGSNPMLNTSHSPTQIRQDRLRYAIQLQFHCTSKKHIYLCKNMRVVFSHRALETDEKLKVVCEGPSNPKYLPLDASTPLITSQLLMSRSPSSASRTTLVPETILQHQILRSEPVSIDVTHPSSAESTSTSETRINNSSFSGTTPPATMTIPVSDEHGRSDVHQIHCRPGCR